MSIDVLVHVYSAVVGIVWWFTRWRLAANLYLQRDCTCTSIMYHTYREHMNRQLIIIMLLNVCITNNL